MDNQDNIRFLLSSKGRQPIINLHIEGLIEYLDNEEPKAFREDGTTLCEFRAVLPKNGWDNTEHLLWDADYLLVLFLVFFGLNPKHFKSRGWAD